MREPLYLNRASHSISPQHVATRRAASGRSLVFASALSVVAFMAGTLLGCGDDDHARLVTATPTPSVITSSSATSSGTPMPSPTVAACPTAVTLLIDGPEVDLDLGTSGINYDTHLNGGDALSFALACPETAAAGCGTCSLTGPVATTSGSSNRRCLPDSSVTCDDDADCVSGHCADLFGPPLPLTAGGVPSCVVSEIVTAGPGTFAPSDGTITLPLTLDWAFFAGIDVGVPCPRCTGAALGDPGTCVGGERNGASCTVHGTEPLLGNTSYDCPPNSTAMVSDLVLPMVLTTGTSVLPVADHCVSVPFAGLPCFCPGQRTANDCVEGGCETAPDGDGICALGPIDYICTLDLFRGCKTDDDCPSVGDSCNGHFRECAADATAASGDTTPLMRVGRPSRTSPLLVGTFCVGGSTSGVLNQGLGLPAPAAIRLPVTLR